MAELTSTALDRGATRSEVGEATRGDLIAAGRKLFARRGFDGSSVRAITREAGSNLGAITYHFGSKRALYLAVLDESLRPMAERVLQVATSEGTGLDRMLRVVETYFEYLGSHPDLPHLLLQELAAGKQPPEVVLEIVGRLRETIAGLQREGVADGSVRDGHPVLTAISVVSQPIFLTLVAPLLRAAGALDLSDVKTRRLALAHSLEFVRAALAPKDHTP